MTVYHPQAMGIKMVLSGEGADEIFAGYLYFHKCPNPEEMQAELKDKIRWAGQGRAGQLARLSDYSIIRSSGHS